MQTPGKKPDSRSSGQIQMLPQLTCSHFHQLRIWARDFNERLTWTTVLGNSKHPWNHISTGLQLLRAHLVMKQSHALTYLPVRQTMQNVKHLLEVWNVLSIHLQTVAYMARNQSPQHSFTENTFLTSQKSKAFLTEFDFFWQLIWLFKQNSHSSREVFFLFSKLTFCEKKYSNKKSSLFLLCI